MTGANQEHGIVGFDPSKPAAGAAPADVLHALPVGTRLRILPNHACATAAQFAGYHALQPDGTLAEVIELRSHPWFIACQFHPEFRSRPRAPHPLFKGFIAAALGHVA
jgi:hypothetical protein